LYYTLQDFGSADDIKEQTMKGLPSFAFSCFAALLALPLAAQAQSRMLIVLDGSNSMWGHIDGTAKIEVAKDVLGTLLSDLPAETEVGLMAYGHRTEGDCADVQLLVPVAAGNRDLLRSAVGAIQPKGKTPIAASLSQSREAFSGSGGNVVLISDGVETCEGDPCAVAGELAAAGLNVRIHVVGFDVGDEERRQLECIATAGKGRYFDAQSAEGLRLAVAEVQAETEAVPPAPEPKVFFEDTFDQEGLADAWEVSNPNPDGFIVEEGKLLLLANEAGNLNEGNIVNLMRLTKSMPAGDWTITARISLELQTAWEQFFVGLYEDQENYLVAAVHGPERASHFRLILSSIKASSGTTSAFDLSLDKLVPPVYNNNPYSQFADSMPRALQVRLSKEGRSYTAAIKLEGVEDEQWMEAEKLTLLRQKGTLAIGFYQARAVSGESFAEVDWVKIETP